MVDAYHRDCKSECICVVVVLCGRGSGVVFVAAVCIVRCCVVVLYGRTCGVVGSVWWWRCGVW